MLCGADDHVIGPDFLVYAEAAYTNRIGPLVVAGAGHFLPWERADVFNRLLPAVFTPSENRPPARPLRPSGLPYARRRRPPRPRAAGAAAPNAERAGGFEL